MNNSNKKYKEIFSDMMKDNNKIKIGEGGAGYVFGTKSYPQYVIKLLKNKPECEKLSKEYDVMKYIKKYKDELNKKYVKIVEMYYYEIIEDNPLYFCGILMERVYNPLQINIEKTLPMIHPLFGNEDRNLNIKGRGIYKGLKQIKELIDDKKIEKMLKELGEIMATLHYKLKLDMVDLEIILGKSSINDKEFKLFILDFDQVQKYSTLKDEKVRENIAKSFYDIEYFPFIRDYYNENFLTAYMKTSKKYIKEKEHKYLLEIVEEGLN